MNLPPDDRQGRANRADINHASPQNATPRGGLPKSVYIRRRLGMLVGLIALVAVFAIVFIGPSSFGSKNNPKPPVPTSPEEDTTQPPVIGPCNPAQIGVEAVTDASEYGPGEFPQLSLRVTSHSENDCDLNLGTETMVFQIHSGSELYWDSRDCQTDASANLVRLQGKQTLETDPITWDRTRSSKDTCNDARDPVPAGGASYHLSAEIAGVKSESTKQFLIF